MGHTLTGKNWVAALCMGVSMIAAPLPALAQSSPVSLAGGYVLGPNDVVEVSVLGRDDYRARVQVQADGTIALPLIGTVPVANLNVSQVSAEITRRLVSGGFFSAPQVQVALTSAVSRYVVVLGEVGSAGVIPIDREYRLSEVIARAGGVRGAGVDVVTLTATDGTRTEHSVKAIATGTVPDPIVNPGAKVFVAPAQLFYIYGQVGAPGSYPIDPDMTIRRALARGGGLTALGTERRLKLYRGDTTRKAALDERLLPGDTIVVGERFF